jgi:uncharacterized protein (TIGR03437 family)
MQRQRKIFWAKTAVIFSAIPVLLWAHYIGPDPGYSGVPKELGTCAQTGCHVGTANDPNNKGGISITFPSGRTYTPGTKQHLVVTVSDPATTQRAWGFQLTARVASSTATVAGTLASTDANTTVMCGSTDLFRQQELTYGKAQTCASTFPLTYIEHSLTGYTASRGKTGSFSYEFDWTPPANDVGDITVYVAANAANGDLTQNGDHIYSANFTLKAASASKSPVITDVINGAGFQSNFAAGSWVAIKGSNLSNTDPRTWKADTEIVSGKLPTALDGVSVTINNKPAFVYYISPTQINVQAPSDSATGSVSVVVNNNGAISAGFPANLQTYSPGFFPWGGAAAAPYIIATRLSDAAFISNPNIVAGTQAAKPGDVLLLWGTGFGPTTPDVPAGTVVTTPGIATTPEIRIDGATVTVYNAALTYAGEYQVAMQVPDSLSNGDHELIATVGGVSSPAMKIFVAK